MRSNHLNMPSRIAPVKGKLKKKAKHYSVLTIVATF